MQRQYFISNVLLQDGWATNVRILVAADGLVTAIGTDADPGAPGADEPIDGFVVPGMPNAHSHAFQRAMAGNAEYRLSARDSFWTWRRAMYALANRITPAELELVATQLYVEMLKSGYTSVAEFHYLHRDLDGRSYAGQNALWDAIRAAATTAGIGLTLLPTLYQTADFGAAPLQPEQLRFRSDTDAFIRAVAAGVAADSGRPASLQRTGVAFHSLRAVPPDSLEAAVAACRGIDAGMPVHIHIAEQVREVDACREATGMRPIEWLLQTGLVTPRWCLVHCTHATPAELTDLAASGAAACLSISTEANLGDGFFDTGRYLKLGGRWCVGSDSQSTVNPAEELRWLEYQQRLRRKRRGVLATEAQAHVGTRLWRDAAAGGAHALGQPVGAIAVGRRADWLVLDRTHPAMAGAAAASALDHLIFAGGDAAIRDVMVGGRWVVQAHAHAAEAGLRAPFAQLLGELSGAAPQARRG